MSDSTILLKDLFGEPIRRGKPTDPEHSVYCRPAIKEVCNVDYCHQHNLVNPGIVSAERRYGIRVTLPANDTLRKVLGDDWERLHWYGSEHARDNAYENMALRHGYYRDTDSPTQILEKIVR